MCNLPWGLLLLVVSAHSGGLPLFIMLLAVVLNVLFDSDPIKDLFTSYTARFSFYFSVTDKRWGILYNSIFSLFVGPKSSEDHLRSLFSRIHWQVHILPLFHCWFEELSFWMGWKDWKRLSYGCLLVWSWSTIAWRGATSFLVCFGEKNLVSKM